MESSAADKAGTTEEHYQNELIQDENAGTVLNSTSNDATVFQKDYSLAGPPISLPTLPEDSELESFSGPAIHITSEHEQEGLDPFAAPPTITAQHHETDHNNDSLSPIIPNSPSANKRRSSSMMRRKSGSSAGHTSLSIPPSPRQRRRSSIASSGSRNEFDDFQEGDLDGSEFGDFDDFEAGEFASDDDGTDVEVALKSPVQPILLPDMDDLEEARRHIQSSIDALFDISNAVSIYPESSTSEVDEATVKEDVPGDESDEEDSPFMLTDRAVSLWKQLTAPPPLQPPDWKRSRIRRLFLVSLGIPVDLDEILPKMTHKKLVLPSTRKREKRSADERRSRRNIPPPPEFEVNGARLLCNTTETALRNMDQRDLQIHFSTLQAYTTAASELLTYWLEQRDSAHCEKETFEQVVQNLVTYHKKQKDEQKAAQKTVKKKGRSRFSMRN